MFQSRSSLVVYVSLLLGIVGTPGLCVLVVINSAQHLVSDFFLLVLVSLFLIFFLLLFVSFLFHSPWNVLLLIGNVLLLLGKCSLLLGNVCYSSVMFLLLLGNVLLLFGNVCYSSVMFCYSLVNVCSSSFPSDSKR